MLKQIKRSVLAAVRRSGGFRLLRDSAWRHRRLLVIGYHGVSVDDEHEWDPAFYVSLPALEKRFELLRDGGYNVLALADAVERLRSGTLPPRSVVLTFDDGMADFATRAFPLLERFGFPATVYLTTYYVTDNRPVFGMYCSYLLWKSPRATFLSTELLPSAPARSWNLRAPDERREALGTIVRHAEREHLSAAAKDALAQRLAQLLHLDVAALADRRIMRLLTPSEVSRLSSAGIDFQLHTHRHRTPVDQELFAREIRDNRQSLLELTGKGADHFCYPSGVHTPEFLPWLRTLGVRSATTCDTGMATAETEPLLLPRLIDTSNLAPIEFESWITGVGAFLPLRPHTTSH